MGLKLKLRAGEKVYLNGALVENGPSPCTLQILNRVPLLREKDIILEKEADTPCKQVYLGVQTLYLSPADESAVVQLLSKLSIDILRAAPSTAGHFESIFQLIGERKYYSALKVVKDLVGYEAKLMTHAKPAE